MGLYCLLSFQIYLYSHKCALMGSELVFKGFYSPTSVYDYHTGESPPPLIHCSCGKSTSSHLCKSLQEFLSDKFSRLTVTPIYNRFTTCFISTRTTPLPREKYHCSGISLEEHSFKTGTQPRPLQQHQSKTQPNLEGHTKKDKQFKG